MLCYPYEQSIQGLNEIAQIGCAPLFVGEGGHTLLFRSVDSTCGFEQRRTIHAVISLLAMWIEA
jgi:hypothetical protein